MQTAEQRHDRITRVLTSVAVKGTWTADDLIGIAEILYASGHQRQGQAYFNALSMLDNTLASMITGTRDDPFYNNDNLPGFFTLLFGGK